MKAVIVPDGETKDKILVNRGSEQLLVLKDEKGKEDYRLWSVCKLYCTTSQWKMRF